jgi:hypothetical protein
MWKLLLALSCLLCLSLTVTTAALVLHENGALVPEDTPEVVAARDLHYEAYSLAAQGEEDRALPIVPVALMACRLCRNNCRKVVCKACPRCLLG